MTRSEFYSKYGNIKVIFSSYYKYTFTYKASLPDGNTLYCDYGGNHDQIYRHDVANNGEEILDSLQPYAGRVEDKQGNEVDSFYDY